MSTKVFRAISSVSMVTAITATLLSFIGIPITGLYPAMIVLFIVALISIASRLYAQKIVRRSGNFQRKYYTTFTITNLLSILIVLWITLVVVHDRILGDCY